MKQLFIQHRGYSLIELLIAIAIFSLASGAIISLVVNSYFTNLSSGMVSQAAKIAEEGLEAIRSIRDGNYLSLVVGSHGLSNATGEWKLSGTSSLIDNFYTRQIIIEDVYRDTSNNIITDAGPGDLDNDTKRVQVNVSWLRDNNVHQLNLASYLSNYRGKDKVETLFSEFEKGAFNGTSVKYDTEPPIDNGTVILKAKVAIIGEILLTEIDGHGHDVFVDGNYAYTLVATGNEGFEVLDVTDVYNTFKIAALDINGLGNDIVVSGNYAYIASEDTSNGLVVVDITSPSNPLYHSDLNLLGLKARGIFLQDDYAYISTNNADAGLFVIDVSDPSTPAVVAQIDVQGTAYGVTGSGDYLYMAVDNDTQGLAVVDISTPTLAQYITSVDVDGPGDDLVIHNNYIYMTVDGGNKNMHILSLLDPALPVSVNNLPSTLGLNGIGCHSQFAFAGVNDPGNGLAIYDISSPETAFFIDYIEVLSKGEGIFISNDYIYVATDTANNGLSIFSGFDIAIDEYDPVGTFISQVLDTASDTSIYSALYWDEVLSPNGDIRLQIRTSDAPGTMTGATFVGSDGTSSTFYEASRNIIVTDPSASGTRYIQYKANLSGDRYSSPELHEVRINYSP